MAPRRVLVKANVGVARVESAPHAGRSGGSWQIPARYSRDPLTFQACAQYGLLVSCRMYWAVRTSCSVPPST